MREVLQKFHTKNVLSVSLAHFIHDVYSSCLAPIIPLLIKKLFINYSYAGLLALSQRGPARWYSPLLWIRSRNNQTFIIGFYMTITFISDSTTALLIDVMSDWFGLDSTFKIAAFLAMLAISFVLLLSGTDRR